MSNKRRRSSKKKHEVPLTEDMLNELNKASLGHQGYMMHGNNHHGMGYDNYGQDPDDFFDSDDVWNNDKYYHGQQRYKVSSLGEYSDRSGTTRSFGFWNCPGEVGLRQVEKGFSSFFANFLALFDDLSKWSSVAKVL